MNLQDTWYTGSVFTLLILVAVAAGCTASDTKVERWADKFTQPAVEVTAIELYKEYLRDDETANDKYAGRRVIVTGAVLEVRDDEDYEPVLEFNVGQDTYTFTSLIAQFAERHRGEVEGWNRGKKVSVVCYVPVKEMADISFDSVVSLRMCQPLNVTES